VVAEQNVKCMMRRFLIHTVDVENYLLHDCVADQVGDWLADLLLLTLFHFLLHFILKNSLNFFHFCFYYLFAPWKEMCGVKSYSKPTKDAS
jgi:hypothetical protein